MDRLKQANGNWVVGDRFWGRQEEVRLFMQRIDEGAHILVTGPRRIGKTSLLRETARLMGDKYMCLFVDLQKAACAMDVIAALAAAIYPHQRLWGKTKGIFANALSGIGEAVEKIAVSELEITIRAGLSGGNWSQKGERLFEVLASFDKPVVLMLDELPIMISHVLKGEDFTITPQRREAAGEFLSWLRANSIAHQGKVRVVVCGSIGLEPILHQARLSATINNLSALEVKPWDDSTAVACIRALGNQYKVKFQEGTPEAMVKLLGYCIPHHVQMFFSSVYDTCVRSQRMECSVETAQTIYHSEMLGVRGHAEMAHYEERLEAVLGKDVYRLALDMLTETAITGTLRAEAIAAFRAYHIMKGRDIVDVQKEVLWVLEHDGYLKPVSGSGYVFASRLLGDWWQARHRMFYVPVQNRGV